jgi:hypothetical protein
MSSKQDFFYQDFYSTAWWNLKFTTISKWLPALIGSSGLDFFNPAAIQWIFLILQFTLLGIGVYYLGNFFIQNNFLSLILVTLFFTHRYHFNNWGWYGDLEFMPYVTWMALGPSYLAFGAYFRNKFNYVYFYLILTFLLHISMGVVFSFALIFFHQFMILFNNRKFKPDRFILIVATIIFGSVVPSYIYVKYISIPMGVEEFGLLKNQHYRAWILNGNEISFNVTRDALLFLIALSVLVIISSRIVKTSYTTINSHYVFIILILNFIFYMTQAMTYSLGIFQLASISWGRFSMVNMIILFAILIRVLIDSTQVKKLIILKFMLFFSIIIPSLFNIYISLVFAIFSLFISKSSKHKFVKISIIFLFSIIILLKLIPSFQVIIYDVINFLRYGDGLRSAFSKSLNLTLDVPFSFLNITDKNSFLAFIIISTLTIIYFNLVTPNLFVNLILVALGMVIMFNSLFQRYTESLTRGLTYEDYRDVQIWARSNTKPYDVFVVERGISTYEAWSTLSLRPRLVTNIPELHPYLLTERNIRRNIERSRIMTQIDSGSIAPQTFNYYSIFSKYWDFNYIVQENSKIQIINLPIVYKNDSYTVFKWIN